MSAQQAGQGLLWRVEKQSISKASYLFGTIHSDDPRVISLLNDQVMDSLGQAEHFCMELELNNTVLGVFKEKMLLPKPGRLEDILPIELWAGTRAALKPHQISDSQLQQMQPWAVFLTLSMPPLQSGQILDVVLWMEAKLKKLPVCSLETAEEQIGLFADLPLARQIYLLESVVDQHKDLPASFEQLIQTYLQRDLDGMLKLSEEDMTLGDVVFNRQFQSRLLDQRNQRMLQRAMPHIEQGAVFIAVGALHLPGANGLIQLLRDQGYKLTALY